MQTGMFNSVINYFKKDKSVAPEANGMLSEIAWANPNTIGGLTLPEYNPDALIAGKGERIYSEMMNDEQVKAVVRFRRNSVTGRGWGFVLDDDSVSESEADQRVSLCYEIVSQMPGEWKTKMDAIMSAVYTGYSIVEKTFDLIEYDGKSWYGVSSLRKKPFHSFQFYTDDYGKLLKTVQKVSGREISIDRGKLIHHVQNSDEHEYYGKSELREAYRAYYCKDVSIKLHNIYLERLAGGFVWADTSNADMQKGSPEHNALKKVMATVRGSSGIIAPKGVTLNVEFPGSTDAFEKAIAGHDKAIAKALLVPNLLGLSEQGQSGSFAQSQTQLDAFLWMLDAEATALEETLNEQLFKQLGALNFSDGIYPKFKLKPLSDDKKDKIINTWKELVAANAVDNTPSDKAHVRQLLDFPEPQEEELEDESVKQDTALTGIQTNTLKDILKDVRTKQLDPETAIKLINSTYPISEEKAKEIIDTIVIQESADTEEPELDEDGNPIDPPGNSGGDSDGPGSDIPADEGDPKEEDDIEASEETPLGAGRIKIEQTKMARAKAEKRVDFAVIDRAANSLGDDFAPRFSDIIAQELELVVDDIGKFGKDITPTDIKTIKFSTKGKQRLRSVSKSVWSSGWRLGQKHAKTELLKTKRKEVLSKMDFERLDELAAEFFDAKSFTMAGSITEEAKGTIQNILSNGIKYNRSTQEMIDEIYKQFASKGLLSKEDVQQALGEALDVEVPDYRLRTIVNTNVFEAVNEARYSFFTDPELNGFVEALLYSAIMDSRTTQICQHLDGKVYEADGSIWGGEFRPPNHYNCRSLLVPIIEGEDWKEDKPPTVLPQQGFG